MQDKISRISAGIKSIFKSGREADFWFSRWVGIYLLLSAFTILRARNAGLNVLENWQTVIRKYPLWVTAIWLVLLGAAVSLGASAIAKTWKVKTQGLDAWLLIIGTFLFSCTFLWRCDSFYPAIGVCLVAVPLTVYGVSRLNLKRLEHVPKQVVMLLAALTAVGVLLFVTITSVMKHMTFSTSCYDMGIFVQMFHSLAENMTAVTTCERDTELSHFYVHASYIYYLLVPVYKLFPFENTLLIAQTTIVVAGVVPLFRIAQGRGWKGLPLFSICVIYLFSDGLIAPCYYHFHENAFLPVLLLWLLYAVERKNYILLLIMAVLVCIVKEDAPLYVICITLYLAIEDKSRNRGFAIAICLAVLAYFVFITNWLTKHGDGSMMLSTRFGDLTVEKGDNFLDIMKNVLSNPAYFVSLFVKEKTLLFAVEIFLPLLFLPFMTRKLHRYLLMLPFLIMNLVIGAGYGYAAEMGYQYTLGTSTLLIYMALINLDDMGKRRRFSYVMTAGLASVVTAVSLISNNVSYYTFYQLKKEHFQSVEACLDTIPEDASVISATAYLPHIADRDQIYLFDNNDFVLGEDGETYAGLKDMDRYDFYVMGVGEERTDAAIPYLEDAGYTLFAQVEDTVVIYKSPAYASTHGE